MEAHLNRAQKRALKNQKPMKQNRSRLQMNNYFTLEYDTFRAIDTMFRKLRTTGLDYVQGEGLLLEEPSSEMIDIESSLEGWLHYWKELAEVANIEYDDAPLRIIANSLKYHKQITMKEIDVAFDVVNLQRKLYRTLDKQLISKVVYQVQDSLKVEDELRDYAELIRKVE